LTNQSLIEDLRKKLSPHPWSHAKAAVAILVKPTHDDLEFFLVKRAEADDDPWSGDIAFPGGKMNSRDNSLIDTAVREVLEETSIDLGGKKPVGFMEPVYSWVRKDMAVQPIVYRFDEYPNVTLNYELTKYFWASLTEITQGKTQAIVKGWETPVYVVKGEIVWGLTYRMIEKIVALLDED